MRLDSSGETLARHLAMVSKWASTISFLDLKRSRQLEQTFVDLDLEFGRLPSRERRREPGRKRISDLLNLEDNVVILGDPGAGKSTSLQRLALGFLNGGQDDRKTGPPLLVRLRDLQEDESLSDSILAAVGAEISYEEGLDRREREKIRVTAVERLLSNMRARVLVDGIDELHPSSRGLVLRDLRHLLNYSRHYRVIITCRTADFSERLENTVPFTIEPLSDAQIEMFARKWLNEKSAKALLIRVRQTPYGGAEILPLTLAHLCAIYERTGSVPEKPRTIYRKIVRLLLEEWDEQRFVRRSSAYPNFETDRKEEFLRALAFELSVRLHRGGFDYLQLDRAYKNVCDFFRLPKSDCRRVVQEIEAHTGLILATSYDKYEFTHKSIQEYLTAEYILRLPSFPEPLVPKAPNEMALVVAMSSDPAKHFLLIVDAAVRHRKGDQTSFSLPFLRRLFLEKADFKPDFRLGCGITELFAATFFASVDKPQLGLPFGVSSRVFRDFFTLDGVRESVASAFRRAHLEPGGGQLWKVLWKLSGTYPDEGAAKPTVIVDSSFLELAGILPDNGTHSSGLQQN